jgi:DNA sulfur modification protein DndC
MRDLINTEHRYRTMSRRAGLFEELEKSIKHSFYENVDEAKQLAIRKAESRAQIETAQKGRSSVELVKEYLN